MHTCVHQIDQPLFTSLPSLPSPLPLSSFSVGSLVPCTSSPLLSLPFWSMWHFGSSNGTASAAILNSRCTSILDVVYCVDHARSQNLEYCICIPTHAYVGILQWRSIIICRIAPYYIITTVCTCCCVLSVWSAHSCVSVGWAGSPAVKHWAT